MGSRTWLALAALAIATACHKEPKDAPAPAPARDAGPRAADSADSDDADVSWYRVEATIDSPAVGGARSDAERRGVSIDQLGRVPFAIGLHRDRRDGFIVSGNERLPLIIEQREPLILRIPVRGVELRLAPDSAGSATGRLRGQWLVKYYFKRDFDITAEPIAGPRPELVFPDGGPPTVDFTGTWRIDIKEFGVGRAIFHQDAKGTLAGTIIPPEVGDLRYLTGRVTGDHGRLSAFDGIHGFLIELTSTDGGKQLTGHWLISGIGDFPFTATRAEAPPTHLAISAHLAPGKTRISRPDLERAPYAGNPVIVDYFGSWCPVCLDLTPELVRLQREHGAAGLQIYSIALEPEADETEARHRLDEFRKAFGMTWPFEVHFDDDFTANLPPEVVEATGFPVTIFLRRDHTVAGIHTGFVSPAAAAEHAAVVKQLDDLAAEIMASPAPPRR